MEDPDPFRPPPRAIPFAQGMLTVVGLAFVGVFLPVYVVSGIPSNGTWRDVLVLASGFLAVGVAVGLAIRWWRPARWRAYGLLTALIGPPVLFFLFVVWFFASGGQIGPR